MNCTLHPSLKSYFSASLPAVFQELMMLKGECFRKQKGRLTQRVMIGHQHYFIKQHTGVGFREIIKNVLHMRLPVISAKNEWLAIQKLQRLGIWVPRILGYGTRGFNPATLQSFILMEELTNVISLEQLTLTWKKSPPPFAFKHQLLLEVARIARVLHQNGMNHRDFYICHFLMDKSAKEIKLYLIDLHRAQIRKTPSQRWLIKDLSGLYFSSKHCGLSKHDGYRFMKCYHQLGLRQILQSKLKFWEKVKKRGEQLYHHHTQ